MKFTTDEVNALLNYLGKQPYLEVAGLIQMLMEKASEKKKKDNTKK